MEMVEPKVELLFFQFSYRWVDIVLLVDLVIVDPALVDLVSWVVFFCGVVTSLVVQVKEGLIVI
jgi:hypothetical protein